MEKEIKEKKRMSQGKRRERKIAKGRSVKKRTEKKTKRKEKEM